MDGGAHVGVLDLLSVNDEQRGGERRLVVLMLGRPVVALVGTQAGKDSPGVAGSQLVLEVERYVEAAGEQMPNGVGSDGGIAPVVGPVSPGGGDGPLKLASGVVLGLGLKLREEPRDAVGVLRLPRPRDACGPVCRW